MSHTAGSLHNDSSESEVGDMCLLRKNSINEPPSPGMRNKAKHHSSLSRHLDLHHHKRDYSPHLDLENIYGTRNQYEAPASSDNLEMVRGGGGSRASRHLPPTSSNLQQHDAHLKSTGSSNYLPQVKREPEESPANKRRSSRPSRSLSRTSPKNAGPNASSGLGAPTGVNSTAAKKLNNFKAAEKAGRTICVCGASAYYERERFALQKEKAKLKEEQHYIREESKRLMENHRKLKEDIFECEKRRSELESRSRSLQRTKEMQQEESLVIEQSRRQLSKLKEQIEKDRDALTRTQQDLILKSEEHAARKQHLERMQQDLKQRKVELEQRATMVRKQTIKNESVEATIQMESSKLASLQSELALESERLKEKETQLQEHEATYDEKRRTLQNLESRLNHEVLMNEEKVKFLENKEAELNAKLQETEEKLAEAKAAHRDLERQRQAFNLAKNDFELARQREMESIETEKKNAAAEIEMSKEDCAAFIALEKEWIAQEKENLMRHKEAMQQELEAEKTHAQKMLAQMKKRNAEIMEEEKDEWKREQQRANDLRNRQKMELDSLRDVLTSKEYELTALKESLASEREQLEQDKAALQTLKDMEMQKLQAERDKIAAMQQELRRERQTLQQVDSQLRARAGSIESREGQLLNQEKELDYKAEAIDKEQNALESRIKEVDSKLKQAHALEKEVEMRELELVEREKRLLNAEAQTAWVKEVYGELQEKKQALQDRERRIEMEKAALVEQRSILVSQQAQQLAAMNATASQTSNRNTSSVKGTPKRPGLLARRFSGTLPQLQTVLPRQSRMNSLSSNHQQQNSAVIAVSSDEEDRASLANRVRQANQTRPAIKPQQKQTDSVQGSVRATPHGDFTHTFPRQDDIREDQSEGDFYYHKQAHHMPSNWDVFAAFSDDHTGRSSSHRNSSSPPNERQPQVSGDEQSVEISLSSNCRPICADDCQGSHVGSMPAPNRAYLVAYDDPVLDESAHEEQESSDLVIDDPTSTQGTEDAGFIMDRGSRNAATSALETDTSYGVEDRGFAAQAHMMRSPYQYTNNSPLPPSHRSSGFKALETDSPVSEADVSCVIEKPLSHRSGRASRRSLDENADKPSGRTSSRSHHFDLDSHVPSTMRSAACEVRCDPTLSPEMNARAISMSARLGSTQELLTQALRGNIDLSPTKVSREETCMSIEEEIEPSLSAPTTSPARPSLWTQLSEMAGLDFNASLGPSLTASAIGDCTESVQECIRTAQTLAFGKAGRALPTFVRDETDTEAIQDAENQPPWS